MPTIEPYAAKEVYDPPMYAQAVKVSGAQTILYIAGQVAYTAEGGAAHANIVKVNTYLTDIRHRADYGPVREEFFGKKMPAHTLVAVAALAQPEFLIEIEAIAVL